MGRSKKKHVEEHENQERWLVSYADFITLLFAFFTVLYATSKTSEEKREAVVDAMNAAFDNLPTAAIRMLTPGLSPNDLTASHLTQDSPVKSALLTLKRNLEGSLDTNVIQIGMINQTLTLAIPDRALFRSGSAELNPEILPLLDRIGGSIANLNAKIRVVGRADSSPVDANSPYRDNWGLALARATAAHRYFVSKGVPINKLMASARVEPGKSPEGRAITIEINAPDPNLGAEVQDKLIPEMSLPENPPPQ